MSRSGKMIPLPLMSMLFFIGLLQLMGLDMILGSRVPVIGDLVSNPTNYIALGVVAFFAIVGIRRFSIPFSVISMYAGLVLFFTVNYFLAPFPLFSWFKYQIAFLLVSFFTCVATYKLVQSSKNLNFTFGFSLSYVLFFSLYMLSAVGLITYFTEYNVALNVLDHQDINEKQKFGTLLAFLILYSFIVFDKNIYSISMILLLLFFGIGSRTMMLGLIGVYLLINYKKIYKAVLLVVPSFILAGVILPDYFYVGSLVYGTRFYSYLNALYIIQNYDFGVGLGGYKFFTEKNNDILLSRFYNPDAMHLLLPTATESDIVYYVSSFGWMGVLLLVFLFIMCIAYASRYDRTSPVGRVFISFFLFLFVAGISQDNSFSVFYWIAFGAAFGTYLAAGDSVKTNLNSYNRQSSVEY